nr:glycosyltransferase family 2 protein [Providencia rettgeri]
MYDKKISTIVLNYNNSEDTLNLLEQLVNSDRSGNIVLVDNLSTDNSVNNITKWLCNNCLKTEVGDFKYKETLISSNIFQYKNNTITFLISPINGGFAFGNNVGIFYSKKAFDSEYYLILNNDITITDSFFNEILDFADTREDAYLIGSVIYLDRENRKDMLQGIGGVFNSFTGRSKHIGLFDNNIKNYLNYNDKKLDYPIGACLLIKSELIDIIGLLNEEYFLYYEELDYVYRLRKANLNFAICKTTKIYHKCGASIESDRNENGFSLRSYNYLRNSRKIFMKKHHPYKYYIFLTLDFLSHIIKSRKKISWKL